MKAIVYINKKSSFCFIVFLSMLSACGLKPLLSPTAKPVAFKMDVTGLEGYINYRFYQELTHQLNFLSESEKLRLKVYLKQNTYDVSYGREGTVLRSQNIIMASYELWQKDALIKKGKVEAISSYNLAPNNELSTLTSRIGSDEKTLIALAYDLAREVMLILQERKNK